MSKYLPIGQQENSRYMTAKWQLHAGKNTE